MLGDQASLPVAFRLPTRTTDHLDGFAQDLAHQSAQVPSAARQDMDVAMRYGLMRRSSFIDGEMDAVRCERTAPYPLGDAIGSLQQMRPQRRRKIRQRFAVDPRDHQDVAWAQGKRVHDGDAIIVLHHPAGG